MDDVCDLHVLHRGRGNRRNCELTLDVVEVVDLARLRLLKCRLRGRLLRADLAQWRVRIRVIVVVHLVLVLRRVEGRDDSGQLREVALFLLEALHLNLCRSCACCVC